MRSFASVWAATMLTSRYLAGSFLVAGLALAALGGNPAVVCGQTPADIKQPETKAPETKQPEARPPETKSPDAKDDPTQQWEQRVQGLVQDLGSSSYFVRENAQTQLARMGYDIVDALTAAQQHDDLEIAKRASYLLRGLKVELREQLDELRKSSPADVVGQLMGYEADPEATRRKKLEALARQPASVGLGPLCRLVQYEQSSLLSREAALLVLAAKIPEGTEGEKLGQTLLKEIGGSLRPGAEWIRVHVQARTQPQEALSVLERLTETEATFLARARQQTRAEIVLGLLRYQAELARRLNRTQQVRATRLRMIELEPGESRTLVELVDELFEAADFVALDEVAGRFANKVQTNAALLYRLAEARKVLNKEQEASELAAKARAVNPQDRTAHYRMAYDLGIRGLWDWSEEEYNLLVKSGLEGSSCNLTLDASCATKTADHEDVAALLNDYLVQDVVQRQERIAKLAEMRPGVALSALCRLVRFEPNDLLARDAAAAILGQLPIDDLYWPGYTREIERTIGKSNRAAAVWLRTYAGSRTNAEAPVAAAGKFGEYAGTESQLLAKQPPESRGSVVLALLLVKHALFAQAGREAEDLATLEEMAGRDPGDVRATERLADLLLLAGRPQLVEKLAQKHPERFSSEPTLLYYHAEALKRQNKEAEANALSDKVRMLVGGDQEKRNLLAASLADKGMFGWAEREYAELIASLPPDDTTSLNAKVRLAGLAEDRGDLDKALAYLDDAQRILQEGVQQMKFQRVPNWIISRVHFCRSKKFAAAKDTAKQLEYLDLAIDVAPDDADVLIALFKASQSDENRKAKAKQMIDGMTTRFREQMRAEPENSTYYNQLAWLVANTEGDQDEALRCSLKSLELRPGTAGYLDTLGHCYFARKDYANAVKVQTQAVAIEPHSVSLSKQLKVFKQTAGEGVRD